MAIYTAPGGRQIPWRPKPPKPPRIPTPDPHPSVPKPQPAPPYRPDGANQVIGPVTPGPFGTAPPPPPPGRPAPAVAPPNPIVAPPAPAAPAAPPIDFQALITGDPRYMRHLGDVTNVTGNLLAQYGLTPDATGKLVANPQANQASVLADLARTLASAVQQQGTANNARGTLFSGATAAQANARQREHDVGVEKAISDLQARLYELDQGTSDLYNSLYGEYSQQAGTLGAEPAAAAGGAAASSPLANDSTATGQERADRAQANNTANAALSRTNGVTALARLYNESKGKVDDSVLRAIDAKLKAARARQKAGQ